MEELVETLKEVCCRVTAIRASSSVARRAPFLINQIFIIRLVVERAIKTIQFV